LALAQADLIPSQLAWKLLALVLVALQRAGLARSRPVSLMLSLLQLALDLLALIFFGHCCSDDFRQASVLMVSMQADLIPSQQVSVLSLVLTLLGQAGLSLSRLVSPLLALLLMASAQTDLILFLQVSQLLAWELSYLVASNLMAYGLMVHAD
jgi:hypothetical protein